jgi:hypothetical protein
MELYIKLSLYLVNQAAHPDFRQTRSAQEALTMKHVDARKNRVARHLPSE